MHDLLSKWKLLALPIQIELKVTNDNKAYLLL